MSVQVGEKQALFTHRIVRVVDREDGVWLETKGDANDDPDPAIIPATSVVGRVAVTIPLLGYTVRVVSTAPGIMFLLALGVFMLAATSLLESLEIDQAAARWRAALALKSMTPESHAGEGPQGSRPSKESPVERANPKRGLGLPPDHWSSCCAPATAPVALGALSCTPWHIAQYYRRVE